MQAQTQRFYPGSVILTYIQSPSNLLEIFINLILKLTESYTCTPLDKHLCQICTPLLYTEKIFLEMNTNYPISLDFDVKVNIQGTYSGTLIISSQRINLGEERTKVESLLKNRIFRMILTKFC